MSNEVYMSPQTRETIDPNYFDFLKKLDHEGEINLPGAIVSQADNINIAPTLQMPTIPEKTFFQEAFEQATKQQKIDELNSPFGLNQSLTETFLRKAMNQANINENTIKDPHETVDTIMESLTTLTKNNNAGCLRESLAGDGIIAHTDVITSEDFPIVPQMIDFLDTVDPAIIENLVFSHEIIHNSQDSNMSRTEMEYRADMKGYEIFAKGYQAGAIEKPEYGRALEAPYIFRAGRAISTVLKTSGENNEYLLNGIAPMPGEEDIVGNNIASALDGVNSAIDTLYESIGMDIENGIGSQDAIAIAEDLVQQQPELLYEKARELLAKGEFSDNPTGERLIENFVDGVQRYGDSDYKFGSFEPSDEKDGYDSLNTFGVAPEDKIYETPEIVTQMEKQYQPRPTLPTFNLGINNN